MSSFDSNYLRPNPSSPYSTYASNSPYSPSNQSPYSSQNQPSSDRSSPFGSSSFNRPYTSHVPNKPNQSLQGSSYDNYKPSYANSNFDNYKSASNADVDNNYKPAYLARPDVKPSYRAYDDRTNKLPTDSNTGIYGQSGDFGIDGGLGDTSSGSKSPVSVTDPENLRYYHMFNLKKVPYKLRHYLYYSEDLNVNFDVKNYNRMDIKMGRPPNIKHYLRFYDMKYDYELNPKGKNYGDMYTLTDKNQTPNIVYTKEYKGRYSNQLDYINFKVYMNQEKYA